MGDLAQKCLTLLCKSPYEFEEFKKTLNTDTRKLICNTLEEKINENKYKLGDIYALIQMLEKTITQLEDTKQS